MLVGQKTFIPVLGQRQDFRKLKLLAKENADFNPHKGYISSLEFFGKSSNEKEVIAELVSREILPGLKKRRTMLDIGTGNGRLAKEIGRHFRRVTTIDSHQQKWALLWRFEHIRDTFPSDELNDRQFDFVLGSHVLYYFNSALWPNVAMDAVAKLEKGGKAVFIINEDGGDAALMINKFGGRVCSADDFAEKCATLSEKTILTYEFDTKIHSLNHDDMMRNAMFLLFDILHNVDITQLDRYVEKNFLKKDGTYEMKNVQKAVVLDCA